MANISSIIIYLYVWKNPVIVPTDAQLNDCDVAGPIVLLQNLLYANNIKSSQPNLIILVSV